MICTDGPRGRPRKYQSDAERQKAYRDRRSRPTLAPSNDLPQLQCVSVPPAGRSVILADPPWDFRTRSAKGQGKSPSKHYPCMSLADILAVGEDLAPLLARDCVLFLWVPDVHLPKALEIGQAWGFAYATVAFYWTKRTVRGKPFFGCGYYTRSNPEQCLLFTRGRPGRPVSKSVARWIDARVGRRHSQKPEESYQRIEALYPGATRLELFGRQERPGWTVLGRDIDGQDIRDALRRLRQEMAPEILHAA